MDKFEREIKQIIADAKLDPGELGIVDGRIYGKRLNEGLVHEVRALIKELTNSRPPSYEAWNFQHLDCAIGGAGSSQDSTSFTNFGGSGGSATNFKYYDETKTEVSVKPIPHQIKPNNAYCSNSDALMRCPHCYSSNDQKLIGVIQVGSISRPSYLCGSCNKVYSELPAYVKVLAKELEESGHQIGFVPSIEAAAVTNAQINSSPQYDYTLQQNTQQTVQKLDQTNQQLTNLTYAFERLMSQVKLLVQQNHKLLEQIATDPLIKMRKNVQEFDLE